MDEKLTAKAKLIYERDNSSPLFLVIADSYLRINNPEIAISILEEGLKHFPDHPLAFLLMGKANVMLNEIEIADFFFKKSSELLNSSQTYNYFRQEYNLPDKQHSPFDSSKGSVFIKAENKQILNLEEEISDKNLPVEERLAQIANELMNKRLEQTDNSSFIAPDPQQYIPDKSRLATETMAKIYFSQGQKSEAIKIYELLSIRNPEKKKYYNEKILEIQSK